MIRWLLLAALVAAPVLAQDAGVDDTEEGPADAGKSHVIEEVKLTFTSSPAGADVWYGKKLLGSTPLVVMRRKDSGPVDVVFRLAGYLTVNSRAYTWDNDKVAVKMTPTDQASTLLGFKKPLEPSDGDQSDLDDDDTR